MPVPPPSSTYHVRIQNRKHCNAESCLLGCQRIDGVVYHLVDEGVQLLLGEVDVEPAAHGLHCATAAVEARQLGTWPQFTLIKVVYMCIV